MLNTCIFSNKFDLIQAICVSHKCVLTSLITRLTLVDKTRLFLKSSILTRIDLMHSIHCATVKVIFMREKCMRVCMTLIPFCHYQLTVATNWLLLTADQCVRTFLMLGTETYHRRVNQYKYHNTLWLKMDFFLSFC
jgi:hypothetical protein